MLKKGHGKKVLSGGFEEVGWEVCRGAKLCPKPLWLGVTLGVRWSVWFSRTEIRPQWTKIRPYFLLRVGKIL